MITSASPFPVFSVIIPSYNRPLNAKAQLASLSCQTLREFEVILVLQGSDFELDPAPYLSVSRLHFADAIGVSRARNLGAKLASGEFIIFLDDDDEPANDWLWSFKNLMDSRPDADVLFCGAGVDKDGYRSSIMPRSGTMSPYLAGTWAIRRTLFEQLGGYDERLRFSENTELLLRAQLTNCVTASIDQVKITYYPSASGGSRNLENRVLSCLLMLEKHKFYFQDNPRVKRLFLRMAGVALIQLGRPAEARKLLWQSWVIAPWEIKAILRLVITLGPKFLSRMAYRNSGFPNSYF